jgi:hypothetical protein
MELASQKALTSIRVVICSTSSVATGLRGEPSTWRC